MKRKGFTLIELLIVVGIIAVLAGIIYVAVDPGRRLAEARNAQRWGSVNSILNAVLKYSLDEGQLPPAVTGLNVDANYVIGTGAAGTCGVCAAVALDPSDNCINLDPVLVDNYLSSIPLDPDGGTVANTGYYLRRSTNNRITAGSCLAENGVAISVGR